MHSGPRPAVVPGEPCTWSRRSAWLSPGGRTDDPAGRSRHTWLAAPRRIGSFRQAVGMKAYSRDLRIRALDALDLGTPRPEVIRLFGVSTATLTRWRRRQRETGGLAESVRPGPPKRKTAGLSAGLVERLGER